MKPLITLCARNNSKGLPGKNWKYIRQYPLATWTVKQAIKWGKGDIVCSTDSEMVEKAVNFDGVKILHRSPMLSLGDTPKLDVLRDILSKIDNKKYDCLIDLDITNPTRTVKDIENCYKKFKKKQFKSLVSVVKSVKNPFFNQICRFKDQYQLVKQIKTTPTDRQTTPTTYDINACIYRFIE